MGLKIKILSKTELNRMPKALAQRLAAAVAAASADASAAASTSARPATDAISGSHAHRSTHHVAEGRRAARTDSPSTPRSTHRAEHRVAAPSTLESSRRTEHRETRRHSKVEGVSMADFEKLKQQVGELEVTTTKTSSRLAKVDEDVRETRGDTSKILALLMTAKNEQAMLPASSRRRAIMSRPTEDLTESESDKEEIEYVPYGKGEQERYSLVPIWREKKKKSTSVGKGGSSAMSSSPSSSSERKDPTRVAGGGAMVVSSSSSTLPSPSSLSKPKKEALPSPSSLLGSRKESTSSMSGSGLVRCTNANAFIKDLESRGWTTLLGIVQSKGDTPEGHPLTAAVNAVELSPKNEAGAVAIACLDRSRSLSAFDPEHHDCMRAAFDPDFPAFKRFCIRMADYCSRSPDKGIKFRGQVYPYEHLAKNDEHLKELIAALRDN